MFRVALVLLSLLPALSFAATGEEVMSEVRAANKIDSSIQTLKMTIVAKSGSERVREMVIKARRDGETRKSLVRVTAPSDEAGTQLLLIDAPAVVDEQLLYLPGFKRTNRISGSSRKGAFMGSDFTYEDLETDAAGATHQLVEETADTWIIDTTPGADSSYSKIRSTISRTDKVARKVEFFDLAGAPLKVLEVLEVATVNGVVLPVRTEMKNLQRGTSTRLDVTERQLGVTLEQLPDETFTKAFMERG